MLTALFSRHVSRMGKDAMPEMSCHDGELIHVDTVHNFQPLQSLRSLYLAVTSKCFYLFPISLKLLANSLDIHWEIGASACQGNKGVMRAWVSSHVQKISQADVYGCLVSLRPSPSATLHAVAFHDVLSITSCKSSGSGSAAWFQEGNREDGKPVEHLIKSAPAQHLPKRWLQPGSAKCQGVPQRLRKLRRLLHTPALQNIDEWSNVSLVLRAWPMQKIPLAPQAIFQVGGTG